MFGQQAFESWLVIFCTAFCFGMLFGLAALMGEALFDGHLRLTRAALALGVGAAMGYLAVAYLIRNERERV